MVGVQKVLLYVFVNGVKNELKELLFCCRDEDFEWGTL